MKMTIDPIHDRHGPPPVPAGLVRVVAHWQGLCRGRALPEEEDLDPAALGPWLAQGALLERSPLAGCAAPRIRLAGAGLSALSPAAKRGTPLCALFAPAERDRLHALAAGALDGPGPAIIRAYALRRTLPDRRYFIDMALLPLAGPAGAVTRAFLWFDRPGWRLAEEPCALGIRAGWVLPRRVQDATAKPGLRVIRGGRDTTPA
jgi:hypothetical protein